MTTLSQRAAGDWRWLGRVLADGNFSIRKYDEVVAYLAANWPDGVAWPADVPGPARPSSEGAAA